MNQMENNKNKKKNNNNSSNSLVYGRWPQTKMDEMQKTKIGLVEKMKRAIALVG